MLGYVCLRYVNGIIQCTLIIEYKVNSYVHIMHSFYTNYINGIKF